MSKTLARIGALFGALLLILILAVGVRALTWKPPAYGAKARLAASGPIDADAAARHLAEAIRFQTVSNQDSSQNQWGEWDRLQAWMQATYPKAHAAMRRDVVAGHTLIYTWDGSDPSLKPMVLMAHQDVVPAPADTLAKWKHPPFAGVIENGVVYGRGSIDDKGALIGLLEAADALARQGFKPKRTVYFVFGHDEEVLGSGAEAAAAWLAARHVTPEFVLDEGGLALTADPLNGRPMALIAVAEKGYATLQITAHGKAGHSSAPPKQTATHVLAKAVDRIASDQFPLRFDGPGAETMRSLAAGAKPLPRALIANDWLFGPMLADKMGATPQGAAMLHTTIAPTVLQGSPKENVLPETATALINYRIHPRDTLDGVIGRARKDVAGLPVDLAWRPGARGASTSASIRSPTWEILSGLAGATTGAQPVPGITTAATDSQRMLRLTSEVYRFEPVLLTNPELATIHGVDERLSVVNVRRLVDFYTRLILTAAG